jgi:hypothetical protein
MGQTRRLDSPALIKNRSLRFMMNNAVRSLLVLTLALTVNLGGCGDNSSNDTPLEDATGSSDTENSDAKEDSVSDPCEGIDCGTGGECNAGDCVCDAGYELNADSMCTDIDECLSDNGGCGENAQCANQDGADALCACSPGFLYNPDGICVPTPKCQFVVCDANSHCEEGDCLCDAGFETNADGSCTNIAPDGGAGNCGTAGAICADFSQGAFGPASYYVCMPAPSCSTNDDCTSSGLLTSCQSGTCETPTGIADNGDGTVTNHDLGITWMKCAQGMTYDSGTDSCTGTAGMFQYCDADDDSCNGGVSGNALDGSGNSQAWDTCNDLVYAGSSDWRVPNKDELKSLIKCTDGTTPGDGGNCGAGNYTSPTIDTSLFPDFPSNWFWTSASYAGLSDDAWYVSFDFGDVGGYFKAGTGSVLCIRSN